MEAEYLRAKVGDALAQGMAETAMARPGDPVEYLGLWLAKYCDNIEAARVQKQIQQRCQEEEEQLVRDAEALKIKQEQEQSLVARDAAELEAMNSIVTSEANQEVLEDSILEFLKTKTGASAAYVGMCGTLKETVPGAEGESTEVEKEVINYTASTSNNKFLIGKQLVKHSDPEAAKKEQGNLTFDMFQKVEDIPAPTEEVPEPAPPEGGWPLKWKEPYVKVVECVREPLIKYFRTPKLGGYLAVPLEYNYELDTMNEGDGPDLVEGECPPFPEYTTTTKTQQGCVGLDTLGTDGQFGEVDCSTASDWTAKLAEGLGRIANEKIEAERATRAGYQQRNVEQWAELNAALAAVAEETTQLLETSKTEAAEARAAAVPPPAEGEEETPVPDEPELELALREAQVSYKRFTEGVVASRTMVETISDRTDEPSRHWQVLQAAMCFAKVAAEEGASSWKECQEAIKQDGFWAALGAFDPSVPCERAQCQSAAAVAAALEGIDEKNVQRTHVPISLLLQWVRKALELHAAAVAVRQAKKAAAEEAGEPFEEQVEDTVAGGEEPAAAE